MIFREFLAVNPSSLYPGSCSFGLWLPSTPQFGGFIAYHNFCFVIFIMLRFFEVDKIFCILLRLNANREIGPPTKARFLEDWGLDGINVPFSIRHLSRGACISPPSLLEHCRCFGNATKGADGAADLLEVLRNSPLTKLDFQYCSQIPSAAWQKVRGASWTNLRQANFQSCLVSQTWLQVWPFR